MKVIEDKHKRQAFNMILRFSKIKKRSKSTIFLPEAFEKGNYHIMQIFL
jgi:hypothetical protein